MRGVRYTLLTDGSSDRVLHEVIDWALHRHGVRVEQRSWADFGRLRTPPKDLRTSVRAAVELYPCDVLFVHRDAEVAPHETRLSEVDAACDGIGVAWVPVIPVRMTEGWLLHDEDAIRHAAGNPNGQMHLPLVPVSRLEAAPDPKKLLFDSLEQASGKAGRRLQQLRRSGDRGRMRRRVAELIETFEPLLAVPAFRRFYEGMEEVVSPWRS